MSAIVTKSQINLRDIEAQIGSVNDAPELRAIIRDESEKTQALGSVSGAVNIDFQYSHISLTATGNITSLTYANDSESDEAKGVILSLTNGGAYTITWTGVEWASGTAPTLTAAGKDVIILLDIGGTVMGFVSDLDLQ